MECPSGPNALSRFSESFVGNGSPSLRSGSSITPLPLKPVGGFHSPPHGFGILRHGSFASVVRHTAGILSGNTVPRQANVAPPLNCWGSRMGRVLRPHATPTSAALRQHRLSASTLCGWVSLRSDNTAIPETVGAFCSKVPRPREVRPRWPCPQCNCHLRQLRFGPVKVGPHLIAFNINLDVRS